LSIPSSRRLKQAGFTLVEVCLVVLVGGILLAMFSDSLMQMLTDSKVKTTQTRIKEINSALRQYANYNNKLPCAANRDLAPTDPNYGVAGTTAQCKAAWAGTISTGGVRIGMVPTRTLNLPDEYGYDGWGSRLTYAVTEALTDTATYNVQSGAISIVDENGNSVIQPAGKGNFLVLSAGPDRKGAFNISASPGDTRAIPCSGTGQDLENCNDDATFVAAVRNSDATGGAFFDDYVAYGSLDAQTSDLPTGAIVPFNLPNCPKGWDEFVPAKGHFLVGAGLSVTPTGGAPSSPVLGYTGDTFTNATQGGWSTRKAASPLGGTLAEYSNLPPYVAYLYCVKN